MDKVKRLEQTQSNRDYQEWQKGQREAVERANGIVADFKAKHSDMTDDQVGEILAEANRSGTYNLELVHRGMRDFDAELEQTRKKAREDLVEELRKKKGAALEPSSQPGKAAPAFDVRKLTEEQRHALMVKELIEGG